MLPPNGQLPSFGDPLSVYCDTKVMPRRMGITSQPVTGRFSCCDGNKSRKAILLGHIDLDIDLCVCWPSFYNSLSQVPFLQSPVERLQLNHNLDTLVEQ